MMYGRWTCPECKKQYSSLHPLRKWWHQTFVHPNAIDMEAFEVESLLFEQRERDWRVRMEDRNENWRN